MIHITKYVQDGNYYKIVTIHNIILMACARDLRCNTLCIPRLKENITIYNIILGKIIYYILWLLKSGSYKRL